MVKNGSVDGFDVEFVRALASVAGFSAKFVPYSWASVLQSLDEGELDFVTAIIQTDQRDDKFDFSIPYLTDYYTLFSREESRISVPEETTGKILAILREDAALERYVIPGGFDKHLILTDTYTEALLLVKQGVADYSIAPFSIGSRIIGELQLHELRASSRNLFPISYRLAVKKGNPELLFRLNEGIALLSQNGVLHDLRRTWFPGLSILVPANHPLRLALARVVILLILAMVFVAVAFSCGLRVARSRSKKLEHERDCLLAVVDSVPLGLRWQNILDDEFFENRFWSEACVRMKNFRTEESVHPDTQHFIGSDGEEFWMKMQKKAFVSDSTGVPVNLFMMEDVTGLHVLENTVDQLAREKTLETARLLIENFADQETGFFSCDFMKKRILELTTEVDTHGGVYSVLFFGEPLKESRQKDFSLMVRQTLRRIDYPGCTAGRQLVILLPETDRDTARDIGNRIIQSLDAAGLVPDSRDFQVFEYPGLDAILLLKSIAL